MFTVLNRNKRSVVINLKSKKGLAILDTLLAIADVLVQKLSPRCYGKVEIRKKSVAGAFSQIDLCFDKRLRRIRPPYSGM